MRTVEDIEEDIWIYCEKD